MEIQPIRTYPLGQTDMRITPIGLGCWQFSSSRGVVGGYWGSIDDHQVHDIVEASLAAGINWFDTAEAYGFGKSERSLSSALSDLGVESGSVVVASKWMPFLRTAGSIVRTFPKRAESLRPYSVDLHQVHAPFSLSNIDSQMNQMAELLDSGAIRAVGVSNFSVAQMIRADDALRKRGHSLASNQVRYSLLDLEIAEKGVVDAARERGITIIAYSPLAQGLLTGKFHDDPSLITSRPGPRRFLSRFKARYLRRTAPLIEELRSVAGAHASSAAQVALAALIQHDRETVVAIPGATKTDHAQQNAAVLTLELTSVELDRIFRTARELL